MEIHLRLRNNDDCDFRLFATTFENVRLAQNFLRPIQMLVDKGINNTGIRSMNPYKVTKGKKVRPGKGTYRGLISYRLCQHLLAKVTHIITVFKIWKSRRVVRVWGITGTLLVVFHAQSHCTQFFHKERIASTITLKTLYTLVSSTKSCCFQVLCFSRAISCWITICSVTFLDFTSIWKKK